MSQKLYQSLPDTLHLREVRVEVSRKGFRCRHLRLVTTLLDPQVYPKEELATAFRCRWHAEILFHTWKSGCRVEQRRFEHLERFLPCLAVYWIVAWRDLWLCRLGRSCPELDCEVVFDPAEWQSIWCVTQPGPVPRRPPPLGIMVRLVTQLGGYVNRPNRADPPGPQTLWLGLQRMHDLARAWNTFGPGASHNPGDV